jgi:hypothetical protein
MVLGQQGLRTGLTMGVGLMAGLAMAMDSAAAAERVVLTYGSLSLEIPIGELDTLAETGEASEELDSLLALANQEPETLRTALQTPMPVNPLVASLFLSSPPGERLLDLVGESIQPTSGEAGSRSALRAAINTAIDDGEVSLLEVLKVYPSPDIVVQGDRLVETYGKVYELIGPWLEIMDF